MAKHKIRVERAEVVLTGFLTPPGLRLDRLTISGAGLLPSRAGLETDGPLAFRAEIRADDLAAFLDAAAPGGLTSVAARISPEGISLRAKKRVLIEVPLAAECLLEIEGRRRLNLRLLDASAFGASMRNLAESEIAKANPVFDAADLPVRAELDRVELGDGVLTLFGEVYGPFDPSAF